MAKLLPKGPLTRPSADFSPQGELTVWRDLAFAYHSLWGGGRCTAPGEGAFLLAAAR